MTTTVNKETLEPRKLKTDLVVRLISASVMLVLLAIYLMLSILYTEGNRHAWDIKTSAAQYVFVFFTMILIGMMIFEISKAIGIKEWWLIAVLIAAAELLFYFPTSGNEYFRMYKDLNAADWFQWWHGLIAGLAVFALFASAGMISKSVQSNTKGIMLAGFMIVIVYGMKGFTHISLALNPGTNQPLYSFTTTIWIWMTIILTDSFAYFGGVKFGKHKLAPTISPKKSIEGAVIGTLSALAIGSVFALVLFYKTTDAMYGPLSIPFHQLQLNKGDAIPGILLFLLTFVISILGQAGDLLFSWIKRVVEIKDFSRLIPGHGGILDRLDSFVFTFFIMFFITLAVR